MSRQPNEEGLRKVLDRLDKDKLDSVGYGKPASLMEDFSVLREYIAAGLDVQKAAQRVWCEKYNPKSPVEETTPQIEVPESQERTPEEGLEGIVTVENDEPVQTIPNGKPSKPYWNPLKKLAAIGALVATLATGLVGGYESGTYLQKMHDDAVHQQQIERVYEKWAEAHEQWNAWAAQQSTRDYKPGMLQEGRFRGKNVLIPASFDGFVRKIRVRELVSYMNSIFQESIEVGRGVMPTSDEKYIAVSYFEFDTSLIPASARIVNVWLVMDIKELGNGEKYTPVCSLHSSVLHNTPEKLYRAVEDGRRYAKILVDIEGIKVTSLGTQACSDLEKRLATGLFSVGIGETKEAMGDFIPFSIDASESGHGPRLYVRYIIPK